MKTLQISGNTARELYKTATPIFKKVLEDTFGEEYFKETVIFKVESYEDACTLLHFCKFTDFQYAQQHLNRQEIAFRKLQVISQALNYPKNTAIHIKDRRLYFPSFDLSTDNKKLVYSGRTEPIGSLFLFIPVSLGFITPELARYAGKQFINLYEEYLL